MLHTGVSFPAASPARSRDALCRAQYRTSVSRGAAELRLAGSLCQGCDKGLTHARGPLETGCQEASAALHALVMLVMEAENTRSGRSHTGGSSLGSSSGEMWMYKGAWSSPVLGIPLGSSSNSGAKGCKAGPDLPPSAHPAMGAVASACRPAAPGVPSLPGSKEGHAPWLLEQAFPLEPFPRVALPAQAHKSTMEQREH